MRNHYRLDLAIFQRRRFFLNYNSRHIPTYVIAILSLFIQSCSTSSKENITPISSIQESGEITAIELMEKELGIKYFQKDLILNYEDNEVILRVASQDLDNLNTCLDVYDLKIEPVFKKRNEHYNQFPSKEDDGRNHDLGNSIKVITEAISIKLAKGVIGYRLIVRLKPHINEMLGKSSKIASYTSYAEHISDEWPEESRVRVYNENGGGIRNIDIALNYRLHWYNTWQSSNG